MVMSRNVMFVIQMAPIAAEVTVSFALRDFLCILAVASLLFSLRNNRISKGKYDRAEFVAAIIVHLTFALKWTIEREIEPSAHDYIDSALVVGCLLFLFGAFQDFLYSPETDSQNNGQNNLMEIYFLTSILVAIVKGVVLVFQWLSG